MKVSQLLAAMEFSKETLGRSDEQQLEEFLSALRALINEDLSSVVALLKVKKPGRRSGKPARLQVQPFDPDQIVAALNASQGDEAAFKIVLERLRGKEAKVASVKLIADKFRHTSGKYKNRDDAIGKIEATWHANRRLASKAAELDDLYKP